MCRPNCGSATVLAAIRALLRLLFHFQVLIADTTQLSDESLKCFIKVAFCTYILTRNLFRTAREAHYVCLVAFYCRENLQSVKKLPSYILPTFYIRGVV